MTKSAVCGESFVTPPDQKKYRPLLPSGRCGRPATYEVGGPLLGGGLWTARCDRCAAFYLRDARKALDAEARAEYAALQAKDPSFSG